MKSASLRALALVFILSLPNVVSAAVVTATVSGPGGTGTTQALLPFLAGLSFQSITYTSNDYIDIALTVDGPGNYDFTQYPVKIISTFYGTNTKNLTGTAWKGIEFINLDADKSTITNVHVVSSGPSVTFDNDSAIIYAPTLVPVNGDLGLSVQITTNGPGTFTLREIPIAVPEVSPFALVGGSFLLGSGIWFVRRRSAA